MEQTIQLINQNLIALLEPSSFWENAVNYILPIVQSIVIIGTASAGIVKYYKTKNLEIYEKLLSEVYAPLYQYLVKQELVRKIYDVQGDYKDSPIFEFTSKTTTNTDGNVDVKEETILDLHRDNIIKMFEKVEVNFGLASKELYTLLAMYKVCIYAEAKHKQDTDIHRNATSCKIDVENKLRKEIISGYKKYEKRVGIKSGATSDFFKLTEDQIIFNYTFDNQCAEELTDK